LAPRRILVHARAGQLERGAGAGEVAGKLDGEVDQEAARAHAGDVALGRGEYLELGAPIVVGLDGDGSQQQQAGEGDGSETIHDSSS
jgi:hypothetical protein